MKTIVAIIEKGDDGGYGIYALDDSIPVVGDGLTEKEAKESFETCAKEQAEYMKEKLGTYPDWYSPELHFEYRYDMTAFFTAFPFINATEFAKTIGINPSLMRKYKSGIAKASVGQKDLIQNQFDKVINRLSAVRF